MLSYEWTYKDDFLGTINNELGLNPDLIRAVCKGKYKQHGGYKWEYKIK
jgi:hypothetical protein